MIHKELETYKIIGKYILVAAAISFAVWLNGLAIL